MKGNECGKKVERREARGKHSTKIKISVRTAERTYHGSRGVCLELGMHLDNFCRKKGKNKIKLTGEKK